MNKVIQCLWGERAVVQMFCAQAGGGAHQTPKGRASSVAQERGAAPSPSGDRLEPLARCVEPGKRVRQQHRAPHFGERHRASWRSHVERPLVCVRSVGRAPKGSEVVGRQEVERTRCFFVAEFRPVPIFYFFYSN